MINELDCGSGCQKTSYKVDNISLLTKGWRFSDFAEKVCKKGRSGSENGQNSRKLFKDGPLNDRDIKISAMIALSGKSVISDRSTDITAK